jgi:predicted RNA-binding protein with PUA-like domain
MKSEPGAYSIQDLKRDKRTEWDGVRNYQARNMMRDEMRIGDRVLFYHSNANPPGVAGIARVVTEPHPDETALDPSSKYYDERHTEESPVWMLIDIEHVETFDSVVGLPELRANPTLFKMQILQRGNRLSITRVTRAQFDEVCRMVRPRRSSAAKESAKRPAKAKTAPRKKTAKKASPKKSAKKASTGKKASKKAATRKQAPKKSSVKTVKKATKKTTKKKAAPRKKATSKSSAKKTASKKATRTATKRTTSKTTSRKRKR